MASSLLTEFIRRMYEERWAGTVSARCLLIGRYCTEKEADQMSGRETQETSEPMNNFPLGGFSVFEALCLLDGWSE